jgi:hypothetical protein
MGLLVLGTSPLTTMTRTLDRVPHFDNRSREYPIRTLLNTTQPRSYTWRCDTWLDQGSEGACVGFAWAHENAARPVERPATEQLARSIYEAAKTIDPWPGEDYDGTSVLAGAKIMQRNGALTSYRWSFNLTDALAAVSRHGPAVAGLNWYTGMMTPDSAGFIRPTGRVEGGHAILVRGVNVKRRTVTLRNSWSESWGKRGDCYLTWDDFGALLADHGELCVPVLR